MASGIVRCGVVVSAWAVVALAAGCATAPEPRYYTLDMHPSGGVSAAFDVQIDRLRESEPVARKNIMIQRSATEIEYYALDQWAASPGELVAQKLDAEFGEPRADADALSVTGTILDFGQVDTSGGADALVRLKLEFRKSGDSRYDAALFEKTYEARVASEAAKPSAVVVALSRCLEQIASAMAEDLKGR